MNYSSYSNGPIARYGGGGEQRSYGAQAPNNQYYYSASPQQSYLSNFQNYDPVALQMRIVKARQVNLMCKQNLVRNIISNRSSSAQDQYRSSSVQNQGYQQPYQPALPQQQTQYPPTTISSYPLQYQRQPQFQQPQIPPLQRPTSGAGETPTMTNQPQFRKPVSSESTMRPPAQPEDTLEKQMSAVSSSASIAPADVAPSQSNESSNAGNGAQPSYNSRSYPDDDEDDAVPLTSRPTIPKNKEPREDAKILSSLAENMTQTVTENVDTLKKMSAARKKQPPAAEKAKRRTEHLIKVSANAPVVMPLWRHKLNGRMDPPKEAILKGVRLFRLIVKSLLMLIIKPTVQSLKRKLAQRERQRKELQKSLRIVTGSLDDWLGKIVQLPVSSVTQDGSLNFEPVESFGSAQPLRLRMLQLKVRLKGVVTGIVKSGMPSELITDFLVALVEDSNYFTAGALWDCEIAQLDFSSLGATRDLVPLATEDTPEKDVEIIPGEDGSEVRINVARARLILQNFIFIRALVSHLLLSPWCYNISGKPSSRILKRCIYNHRVLATGMYELVRSMDPALPVIEPHHFTGAALTADHAAEGDEAAKFINMAKASAQYEYHIGDSLVAGPKKVLDPPLQIQTNPTVLSTRAGTALGMGLSMCSPARIGTATAQSGRAGTASAAAAPSTAQSARRTSAVGLFGAAGNSTADADPTTSSITGAAAGENASGATDAKSSAPPLTSLLGKFAKYVGITDVAVFEPSTGSIENYLLEPRAEFTALPVLHSLLIPPAQLGLLRTHFDEWFPELKGPLREWLRQLVVHVLKRRQLLNKIAREKKEAAAVA